MLKLKSLFGRKPFFLLIILLGFVLGGCTTVPLTKYAKTNDLVTVPLGGSKTVANSNYLKTSDVTVTVTDSQGQVFPAPVYRLFRVYADPTSRYALVSGRDNSELNGIVYANEGQWMLQFSMPASNENGESLAPGLAQVNVQSTEVNPDPDPKNRRINTDLQQFNDDLANMEIEILPGASRSLSLAEAYAVGYLANGAVIMTAPDDESVLANNVAGAVLVYEYNTASFVDNGIPYAVKNSPDQNIQLITKREDMGAGVTRLTAMVVSPKGFFDEASWTSGTSYYDGLYIAICWDHGLQGNNIVTDESWQQHISLVADESFYIDIDGNAIAGVSPFMEKVR